MFSSNDSGCKNLNAARWKSEMMNDLATDVGRHITTPGATDARPPFHLSWADVHYHPCEIWLSYVFLVAMLDALPSLPNSW
jgi:hypothetical protein